MQQQDMPQKIMNEIVRLHSKLVEAGASDTPIVADTTAEVINDKLVYTDTLKAGNKILAQTTRIDQRPLAEIKTAMEADKARLQQQANELVAKVDEVLTVVNSKNK
jgi:hydrogenase maturation factor